MVFRHFEKAKNYMKTKIAVLQHILLSFKAIYIQ